MLAPISVSNDPGGPALESRDQLPAGVAGFGPGYDDALDPYAYMLDALRRDGCRRLRGFCANGRGRFSTWLVVVARRLCLDHHRLPVGRRRAGPGVGPAGVAARRSRLPEVIARPASGPASSKSRATRRGARAWKGRLP